MVIDCTPVWHGVGYICKQMYILHKLHIEGGWGMGEGERVGMRVHRGRERGTYALQRHVPGTTLARTNMHAQLNARGGVP